MIGTRSLPWWLTVPASFIATHAAASEPAPVRVAPPSLNPFDPGDVEACKALLTWLTNGSGHCELADQDDFGHEPRTLPELIVHLRERAAQTKRLDDVTLSKAELLTVLDAAAEATP